MGLIFLIIIVLLLVGVLPRWPYSTRWGYYPSGILGVLLVIFLLLMILNMMPYGISW